MLSLDSSRATQAHSQSCPQATPLLSWLCAQTRVLLKDELPPQSEVKCTLEQVSIRDVCVYCCSSFASFLTSLLVSPSEKSTQFFSIFH